MGRLADVVARLAQRQGPLSYEQVVDLALYHPEWGFFASGAGAGRGSDFITSPEVGPLFGAVLARALDRWWDGVGRPDPFVVVEAGAGSGALASAILEATPECSPALRYVLVERSAAWRAQHGRRLRLEPPGSVLGPIVLSDPDEGPQGVSGVGPLATSLAEMPVGPLDGVVLANELLDNLPFRLLERGVTGWEEVRVTGDLSEVLVPAEPDLAVEADELVPDAEPTSRVPLQHRAGEWLREALAGLRTGRVVVIDYGDVTPSLARRPWTEWVRTYRHHGRGSPPLQDLGDQDITCEVAVDQLGRVRPPVNDRSQAEFLRAHGIEELVEEARRTWQERAATGDLPALVARSRVTEHAALVDPAGLGGFRVLEWEIPGS